MSAVQKLSRFQVRFLQHARRRRRLCNLACPRVPVPSSCRSLSGAFGTQAPASGAKTWNESSLLLSPAVRFLLGTNNIDPSLLIPTGPNNRLLKSDILQYLEDVKTGGVQSEKPPTSPPPRPVKPVKQPVPPTEVSYTDIPIDSTRRAITQTVTLSKTTIPYSYATVECKMDELLELRRKLKDQGVLMTVNDFLIKAAALTMECLPQCNAVWSGNDVQLLPTVDISVAVATESGLITPIVKEANKMSMENISTAVKIQEVKIRQTCIYEHPYIKELASRARSGQLQPHEFQGGGFSISNLGMYGVTEFTAIINPLHASILAAGTLQVALSEGGTLYRYINTTLSSDVRVINSELACRWLEEFKRIVEAPNSRGLI